jgi:carbonic anhydrase
VPRTDKYFSYSGSLTTPPFGVNVSWVVGARTLDITPEDLQTLKPKSKGTRLLHPRNGRDIVLARGQLCSCKGK